MTPYERHRAVLQNEKPDKIDVIAAVGLRTGPQGGWIRRLSERGMGLTHIVPPYRPMFFFDMIVNPFIKDITYSQTIAFEDGVWKTEHTFSTKAGEVSSVVGQNPGLDLGTGHVYVPFIKEEKDWRVINYLFKRMYEELTPNYKELILDQEDLGEKSTTIGVIDLSPFQRVFVELSSIEQAVYTFFDEKEYFHEFLEIQDNFHRKAAEICAESPAYHFELIDNITNTISPEIYSKYCMPVYRLYTEAFRGTDKKFAVHHDGLLAHLKEEMAAAPFDIVDSFTVPPVGNMSLTEAKELWPDKIITVNLPPHLAHSSGDEIRKGYEAIVEEWGGTNLVIEHVEDMPEETLELHLNTALDVCGYPG